MADTYTQIYIQIVFAVKGRQNLIHPSWEEKLHKYITGVVKEKGQKMMAINGVQDHIHILISMKPTCNLSDLVREIKKSSNAFVNENRFTPEKFQWQEGFGAFSYSASAISNVIDYIHNQKEHHRVRRFKDEFTFLLDEYEVDYKDEYLFDW